MCAGIGAPGTLREILRGYFGDKNAPERFRDDDVVKAGFVTIGPGEREREREREREALFFLG